MPKVKKSKNNLSIGQEDNNENGRQKFNLPYRCFDNYKDLENFVESRNLQVKQCKKDPCTLCDKRSQTNIYIVHKMEVKFRKCNQDNCKNFIDKKPCFRTEKCLLNAANTGDNQRCYIMTTKNHTDSDVVEGNIPLEHNFNNVSDPFAEVYPDASYTSCLHETIDSPINQITQQNQCVSSSNESFSLNLSDRQFINSTDTVLLNCQMVSHFTNTVKETIHFKFNIKIINLKMLHHFYLFIVNFDNFSKISCY